LRYLAKCDHQQKKFRSSRIVHLSHLGTAVDTIFAITCDKTTELARAILKTQACSWDHRNSGKKICVGGSSLQRVVSEGGLARDDTIWYRLRQKSKSSRAVHCTLNSNLVPNLRPSQKFRSKMARHSGLTTTRKRRSKAGRRNDQSRAPESMESDNGSVASVRYLILVICTIVT